MTFATFSKFAENAKLETLGTFFKEYGVLSVLIRSYLPSYPLYNTVLSTVQCTQTEVEGSPKNFFEFYVKKTDSQVYDTPDSHVSAAFLLTRWGMILRWDWLARVYVTPGRISNFFITLFFIILFYTTFFYKNFF